MSRKSRKPRRASTPKSSQSPTPPPPNMEQVMQMVTKLLEEQDFESIEEANAFLAQLTGGPLPPLAPETDLDAAQELCYEAWETSSRTRRRELARCALKRSPDCTDAYVILAHAERDSEKALALFAQGVEAGERALGPDSFEELEGEFWGFIETRPYMRARAGLADTLRDLGRTGEAIAHYQELLRLNPNDNQGLRYLLADALLEADRGDELGALLKQYKDDTGAWMSYTRALHLFRRHGAGKKADKALRDALRWNPHIPAYLLGTKKLPRQMPPYYSPGSEEEAALYVEEGRARWRETPGALDWLRSQTG